MKTHLIHLDQDDNVNSIIDKLLWGKASRILLVFPTSPGFNLKKIDLLLIKRAAKKQGFSLAIVSRLNEVKLLASEVQIPVYKSINHAQRRTWTSEISDISIIERKSSEDIKNFGMQAKLVEPAWKNLIGIRLLFFSLGVLAVLTLSLLFIPSATIKLDLPIYTQSITMKVIADENVDTVNLSGTVPIHIKKIEVEGTRLASVTTKANVPDKYSVGRILFTNLTASLVEIPLGTIISRLDNTGIRFETIEKGELQAGVGQTMLIPVRALTPGEAGNMQANSLGSLIGDLGSSISAINPDPVTGGTDKISIIASERDRNELFSFLESDLKTQAIQAAQDQLALGDIIFPDTVKIEEILEQVFVPAVGQPGDRLSLDLRLIYIMQYSSYSDLVQLSEPALKADLPDGYVPLADKPVVFNLLSGPTPYNDGTTGFSIQANRNIMRSVDQFYISQIVQGLSVEEAINILKEEYGQDSKPVVDISPSWWSWFPIVTLRIAIIY